MLRSWLLALSIGFGSAVSVANACSIAPPPVERIADDIAARGVLIRGTLIQAFNASKHQPEIIRAHEIYVGEGRPRDFVIYRSQREYDRELNPPAIISTCDGSPPPFKVGHVFDRLVLIPSNEQEAISKERWSFSSFGGSVAGGTGLRLLAEGASRVHRLRSLPPKEDRWGD